MVRRVVFRTAGIIDPITARSVRRLLTESDLAGIGDGESFAVPAGALISPLARQAAFDRRIALVELSPVSAASVKTASRRSPFPAPARGDGKNVVLGADHGGFELKEILKEFVQELGYSVIDCGTDSGESVDYPDFAFAAARLVAQGKAWRAILVDGAGIGSCMAANKVPGVRAAMCYDETTAVNSREHNHSNVLTLGAGMIDAQLGRQIVKTWLATDDGGGRHERRVKKIMDIEKRYLKA
ncbi:MAG: RpiB/LacA/LacB family sugar-phosphate isomerase [Gemmatimonadales bacterium]|nr:MAG: RpiB/LacA/LacB family sugar-phosphate isomerase [Gemmatimonadales bacterium]